MSKSLIKLIDAALLPAAIMICGKVAGLWFANVVFDLNWGIVSDPNNFFSVRINYLTIEEQVTATSYSNMIMYLFVLCGFLIILSRAMFFSSTRISPSMLAKLASNNLLSLIKDSFEIYHQASVWLVVLWLSFFALIVNVLIAQAYVWTGVVSFVATLLTTLILFRDVLSEIEIAKKNLSKVVSNSTYSK